MEISGWAAVAEGFAVPWSGCGRLPEPEAGKLCGPVGPHKTPETGCRLEHKSLRRRALPVPPPGGGLVLC